MTQLAATTLITLPPTGAHVQARSHHGHYDPAYIPRDYHVK